MCSNLTGIILKLSISVSGKIVLYFSVVVVVVVVVVFFTKRYTRGKQNMGSLKQTRSKQHGAML